MGRSLTQSFWAPLLDCQVLAFQAYQLHIPGQVTLQTEDSFSLKVDSAGLFSLLNSRFYKEKDHKRHSMYLLFKIIRKLLQYISSSKLGEVAHTCNPSYSGGVDQEDHSLSETNSSKRKRNLRDFISTNG
jgi:hypothetical protein